MNPTPSIATTAARNLPSITQGRGLMLVGPQGSGKTQMAFDIAKRRGGDFYLIDADELDRTRLPNHLMGNRTLIVSGIPNTPRALAHVKQIVTSKEVSFKTTSGEVVGIEPPALIVCAEEADEQLSRRIDVVHVELATA